MLNLARNSLFATMVAVGLTSCRNDTTGTDRDALIGEYTLISIDGASLPVIVEQTENDMVEVIEGTIILSANGTFGDVTELRITLSGVVSTDIEATQGSWSVAETIVTFAPTSGSGNYSMTWDGQDRLTQLFQGFTLVYER